MAERSVRIDALVVHNAKNDNNLAEKEDFLAETALKTIRKRVNRHADDTIVSFSSTKYIERLDIFFETAVRCMTFLDLSETLCITEDFLVENVRWKRLDTHLTVVQATFVRFKPVEE